jgi:hypothetical protein
MTARFNVLGVGLSAKQATMLCALVKKPMAMDGLNGFDCDALEALNDQDCIEIDETKAAITDKGRKVVIELSAKVNGATDAIATTTTKTSKVGAAEPRRDSREKPAPLRGPSPAHDPTRGHAKDRPYSGAPISPPPTGVVDFDALRARIVEHYEADLAACDRMREIAARVGA